MRGAITFFPSSHSTQIRGIMAGNAHTPIGVRMGRQASGPENKGFAINDVIYQSKKQGGWAEAKLLNAEWFRAYRKSTARAFLRKKKDNSRILQPIHWTPLREKSTSNFAF
jgi:hypothetical protein